MEAVHFYDTQSSELYDLKADLGEQRDLSGVRPEVAAELLGELRSQLKSLEARLPVRKPAAPPGR